MFVVTGASGQTGSAVMRSLLKKFYPVRALVRREEQRAAWLAAGAQAVVVDLADSIAVAASFAGARGAYLMNPPAYSTPDIFAQAASIHTSMITAAERAGIAHVVALSSIGAQHAEGTGNILTTHDFEQKLDVSGLRATILRAANFLENWAWSLGAIKGGDILPSMLAPVTRALPMVSTWDIGRVAADLLIAGPEAPALVELQGPANSSPADAATAISAILGRPIMARATPEADWPAVFSANDFSPMAVDAFCAMYRGFNNGHVAFSSNGLTLHGKIAVNHVMARLLADANHRSS
jgi:uncharacterized protein YbjT (DUF2867 family)